MPGNGGLSDHGHLNANMPGSNHLVVAVEKRLRIKSNGSKPLVSKAKCGDQLM